MQGQTNPRTSDQSKKGQSSNKKARRPPAQPMSTSYLFRKVANEEVEIEVQGRKMVVTRWEGFVRQIHTLTLNNNRGAARLLHQIRMRFPGKAASKETHYIVVSDNDLKV